VGPFAAFVCVLMTAPTRAQGPDFATWQQADPGTQRIVLGLARRAFDAYVLRHETIDPPHVLPPCLRTRAGVFVSTMRAGAPRCCMGTLYPTQPDAAEEIIANAVAAAGRDRRFPPIKPSELGQLRLIVSIVSPPHPIAPGEISSLDPTRDGLVVQYKDRSGVILSGETDDTARMVAWGRLRAGARPNDPVQFFRIRSVRFVEPTPGKTP
jgi:hypothetical protein